MSQNTETIKEALDRLQKVIDEGFDRIEKRLDSLEETFDKGFSELSEHRLEKMVEQRKEIRTLLEKIENNLKSK
ncbi:hypothetical protein [Metabacillus idriensis]|uniref:hypothetical protein n=1 Tax=Metabacillus idriensis TaxID=324768 RepID=UPI00174D4654|nr:hypothetical protein [Metabacillus idriensis]